MNSNRFTQNAGRDTMIGSVIGIVIGLLLLINPTFFMLFIVVTIGIMAILFGAVAFIKSLSTPGSIGMVGGGIAVILGILIIVFRGALIVALPILIGLFLLVGAIVKISDAMSLRAAGDPNWWINLIFGVISVVFAVLLLIRPLFMQALLFRIMGAFLMIDNIGNILSKKRVYDNQNNSDNVVDGQGREL